MIFFYYILLVLIKILFHYKECLGVAFILYLLLFVKTTNTNANLLTLILNENQRQRQHKSEAPPVVSSLDIVQT